MPLQLNYFARFKCKPLTSQDCLGIEIIVLILTCAVFRQ